MTPLLSAIFEKNVITGWCCNDIFGQRATSGYYHQAWAIHTFSQQYQYQCNSAKYWYNTNTIQYNAISFSIDYNSSQCKNVYRMMQGYVWIVIAIMKKMYMIYKMHKETFCFVRLLGNSLILIHTIHWRNCFGRKNHGGGGRIVVCGLNWQTTYFFLSSR